MGLYYHDAIFSLLSVIEKKDLHIHELQEKLKDLGGTYFPRKYKELLDALDPAKWRNEVRRGGRWEERVSGWEVFERWGEVGEEGRMDWQAGMQALGAWTEDKPGKAKVQLFRLKLMVG